jgi:hypothetical protein
MKTADPCCDHNHDFHPAIFGNRRGGGISLILQKPFSMTDQISLYVGTFCQRRVCLPRLDASSANTRDGIDLCAPTGRGLTHQQDVCLRQFFDAPDLGISSYHQLSSQR